MRRTPLRRRSKKAVAAQRQYLAACRLVRQRSAGLCEARGILPHRCQGAAREFHHVKRRSQGGANTPENLRHLCSEAHRVIHAEPALAAEVGLLSLREWT